MYWVSLISGIINIGYQDPPEALCEQISDQLFTLKKRFMKQRMFPKYISNISDMVPDISDIHISDTRYLLYPILMIPNISDISDI